MFICITNGSKRDSENYDSLIDIGKGECFVFSNWIISKCGATDRKYNNKLSKRDFQRSYKKGINQVVGNDSKTNFTWETPTGEIIEFVGIGNHLEKEI